MKIRLLLLLSLLCIFWSCKNELDIRIPNLNVYLRLDLLTTDSDLVPVYASKRFIWKKENAFLETDRTGYGGVLVFHGLDNGIDPFPYYAFDLSCPNEASPNILLKVVGDVAVCSVCKSEYELSSGSGLPLRGDAKDRKFRLKRYQVNTVDKRMLITN